MNKVIAGEQCTIGWHVDDIKISHHDPKVVDSVLADLAHEFGQETPLTITQGPIHDYFGMHIDFSEPRLVQFSMNEYIEELIVECPEDLTKGVATTPAASHLFQVNPDCRNSGPLMLTSSTTLP